MKRQRLSFPTSSTSCSIIPLNTLQTPSIHPQLSPQTQGSSLNPPNSSPTGTFLNSSCHLVTLSCELIDFVPSFSKNFDGLGRCSSWQRKQSLCLLLRILLLGWTGQTVYLIVVIEYVCWNWVEEERSGWVPYWLRGLSEWYLVLGECWGDFVVLNWAGGYARWLYIDVEFWLNLQSLKDHNFNSKLSIQLPHLDSRERRLIQMQDSASRSWEALHVQSLR